MMLLGACAEKTPAPEVAPREGGSTVADASSPEATAATPETPADGEENEAVERIVVKGAQTRADIGYKCVRVEVTGSRIKRKVCTTRAQREEERKAGRELVEGVQRLQLGTRER
ncbi:MAG: hypothetical protein AAFX94_21670 [Myxococcota bacterium]